MMAALSTLQVQSNRPQVLREIFGPIRPLLGGAKGHQTNDRPQSERLARQFSWESAFGSRRKRGFAKWIPGRITCAQAQTPHDSAENHLLRRVAAWGCGRPLAANPSELGGRGPLRPF